MIRRKQRSDGAAKLHLKDWQKSPGTKWSCRDVSDSEIQYFYTSEMFSFPCTSDLLFVSLAPKPFRIVVIQGSDSGNVEAMEQDFCDQPLSELYLNLDFISGFSYLSTVPGCKGLLACLAVLEYNWLKEH